MSEQEVIVRRVRAEDVPGIVVSSSRLFAEDGGERDPGLDVDWPRRHGAETFGAALHDPGRLLLAAPHDGEVAGHPSGSMSGPTAPCAPSDRPPSRPCTSDPSTGAPGSGRGWSTPSWHGRGTRARRTRR